MDAAAQNPGVKSRAGSTPSCKIPVHGNNLSLKPSGTLRAYFENANGLPHRGTSCNSQNQEIKTPVAKTRCRRHALIQDTDQLFSVALQRLSSLCSLSLLTGFAHSWQ